VNRLQVLRNGLTVSQDSSPRNFVVSFLVFFFVLVCAIPLASIIIDPFFRFDLVTIEGFNAQKPQFAGQARLAKPGVVCRLQPGSVILGTSRVEVGINPRHPGWNPAYGPVYNLGLAGSGLKELYLTLQHAVHASPRLRVAVIGLDFLMFNAHREAVVFGTEVLGFDAKRLLLSPDDSCWKSFSRDIGMFLGTEGLANSFATVGGQMPLSEIDTRQSRLLAWLALYDRDGYRGSIYDRAAYPLREGFRVAFDTGSGREAGQEKYYASRIWRPAPEERYCFERDGHDDTISLFRAILDFARASHIDVRFFINPIHARMLVAIQEAGLWPQYEDWKRRLVSTLAEEAAASNSSPFPFWDFSGINTVTTELVPPLHDRTEMKWWWEPSHYRSHAGDLILDRILDYRDPVRRAPDDFGVALNSQNIDSWILKTREGVRDFARAAPDDAQIVRDRIEAVMKDAGGSNCGYDEKAVIAGSQALARGDRRAAEAAFSKAVSIHEADRKRFEEIGVPYRETAFDKDLATARAGIELSPKLASWQDYQDRGNRRLAEGKLREAAEDFSTAIRLGPPNAALYFLRGTTRMRLEQFEMAGEDFVAGLAQDPNNPTLQSLLKEVQAKTAEANSSKTILQR
jgi:tetratricopeptide (TPR) repeat protein